MARGWPRIRLLSGAGVGEIPDGHRWDAPPKVRFARDSPLEEGVWSEPVSEVGVFAAWELRYSEAFMDDNSSGKGLFRAQKRRRLSLCPWQLPPLSGS